MKPSCTVLLEKAYLAITKPMPSVPSDEVELGTPEVMSPSGSIELSDDSAGDCGCNCKWAANGCTCGGCPDCCVGDETSDIEEEEKEEDLMSISDLDSIRESIMKIAQFCATGKHLHTWQQQKLAIAMDNLSELSRSLRRNR